MSGGQQLADKRYSLYSYSALYFTVFPDLCILLKMLYLIGPDGLINLGCANFQKSLWMTMVHFLRFNSFNGVDDLKVAH